MFSKKLPHPQCNDTSITLRPNIVSLRQVTSVKPRSSSACNIPSFRLTSPSKYYTEHLVSGDCNICPYLKVLGLRSHVPQLYVVTEKKYFIYILTLNMWARGWDDTVTSSISRIYLPPNFILKLTPTSQFNHHK